MPSLEQVRAGTRKGIQKLIDKYGLDGAANRCGLTTSLLQTMLESDDGWPGVGAQVAIADALGIRLDDLTSGAFRTHAEDEAEAAALKAKQKAAREAARKGNGTKKP